MVQWEPEQSPDFDPEQFNKQAYDWHIYRLVISFPVHNLPVLSFTGF